MSDRDKKLDDLGREWVVSQELQHKLVAAFLRAAYAHGVINPVDLVGCAEAIIGAQIIEYAQSLTDALEALDAVRADIEVVIRQKFAGITQQ